MRLSQLHVILLGFMVALPFHRAHRRLGLQSRGVPNVVGDFSKTLDGAITFESGVGTGKGSETLGHLSGSSDTPSMEKDHQFHKNFDLDWEPSDSSRTDSSRSSGYDEVVSGSSNSPDSSIEPERITPLAEFFRGTRDPHIDKLANKVSPPREKSSKLKRIFGDWKQKFSKNRFVKWLRGTKSSSDSLPKPKISGVSSIWSKIKFRFTKGSHPGGPVSDGIPATGTNRQNRAWGWLKSIWRKITSMFSRKTSVHPDSGSESVPTTMKETPTTKKEVPAAQEELVQATEQTPELRMYAHVLEKAGSILAHPPEELEGFLDETKLFQRFKEELIKAGFSHDTRTMGKQVSLLMRHYKIYMTADENLAKFSKEFLEWEQRFNEELSNSLDTWIVRSFKDILRKNIMDGISETKSKTIQNKHYSQAEKLVSKISPEHRKVIVEGLNSKDPYTKKISSKKESTGKLHVLMNTITSKLNPKDEPSRKLMAELKHRLASRTEEDIDNFIDARAVQLKNKIKESYKSMIQSQGSHDAYVKALVDLTQEKLVQEVPSRGELAHEYYQHQLIKGFEEFIKPLEKDAEKFIKARVKEHIEPILHDRRLMEDHYRDITDNLIKLNHNGVMLDKLFKETHNINLGLNELIEKLKTLFKHDLPSGQPELSNEKDFDFLYQMKQKGILNAEEHHKLNIAALKSNEEYENILHDVLVKSKQLNNNLHEAIKNKVETPMTSDQDHEIIENTINYLVKKELNSLEQKAKSIYLEPSFLSDKDKLMASKLIELYSEKGLNEFLGSDLSMKEAQRVYSENHFSKAVSTARPVEKVKSEKLPQNKVLLSLFLDEIGVSDIKFSELHLTQISSHKPMNERKMLPLFNEKLMVFDSDPLKVGDTRLKGTHFENLDKNSINELNTQVRFIADSMPQIIKDVNQKAKSWKAIEKINSSPEVKKHMDIITKVLKSITDRYSNQGSKVWYMLDPLD